METGIFLIYSLNGWSFNDPKVCGITVVSGRMTNIHPEATELINPEMASPKVFFIFQYLKTHETVESIKKETNVVVGTLATNSLEINNSETLKKNSIEPVFSKIVDEIPYKKTVDVTIHDMETNERLDRKPQEKVQHGIDQPI